MKNFKKIESKKLISLLMAVVMILQVLVITPTYADDTREKISKIVATSDTDSIPKYGEKVKDPEFNVTEGSPAYFKVSITGSWRKKDGTSWARYTGATFTEGTYKYQVQVRIDPPAGKTHVLNEDGITVLVDGNKWADNERPNGGDDYSYLYVDSKEYVITAPVGAPLDFVKNNSWDIGVNYVDKAITSFSVAIGATGGEKPYTFSKVSGPDWINVASDGIVSGTPNSVGINNDLVIRVTDKNLDTKEITLTVAKTFQDPSTREKISKIVATSDTDSIPVYGGKVKDPEFNVTEGSPAYFKVSITGSWRKKDGTSWARYTGATFTEGTYKYQVQVRIDPPAGKTHVLNEDGITVLVDGNKWADNERPNGGDDYSYLYVESKEYVITAPDPSTRTKISNIVATSDIDSIPKYGEKVKAPTFTVTEGAPAYFDTIDTGHWMKKNGEKWNEYKGKTFTDGTYCYFVQIRVDGDAGKTHVLASKGVTATVNGKKWTGNTTPTVWDTASFNYVSSKEYKIIAPTGTPLDFVKDKSWNIILNYKGKAIKSFSVAIGATGGEIPYTFSKVSGPEWIKVASDGTVSGTPNSVGKNSDLVIRVTDKASATKDITLTVAETVIVPSDRIKISNIVATSDIDSIPVYGGQVKAPTFTVTEGAPAYFDTIDTGHWMKKNGEKWNEYKGKTFTDGTYCYFVQIRVDGDAGKTHVLASKGVTATVNGKKWTGNTTPTVWDTASFNYVSSKEYVISKTTQEKAIDIPKANTNLVYTGNLQKGVNEGTGYTLTGNTATNAGTYTAKATLKAGYKWNDGITDVKEISFEIKKARPTFTEPTGLKGQKGAKLSTVTLPSQFKWKNGDLILNTVGDNTYYATFTPADTTNYEVIDVDLTVKVEDNITPPPAPTNPDKPKVQKPKNFTYDGTEKQVTLINFDESTMTLSGDIKKTDAGAYTLYITSKTGTWSDGSTEPKEVEWEIFKAKLDGNINLTPIEEDGKTLDDVVESSNFTFNGKKVDGTITWIGQDFSVLPGTTTVEYQKSYNWIFKPSSGNFEDKSGSVVIYPSKFYEVSFEMNGNGTQVAAQKVKEGEVATEPTEPTETGFTFDGWYKEATFENKYDFNTKVTGNITLYAKWTKDVTPPTPPTVTGIAVNSTTHKKEYKVGEELDVTDLTIEVTKSDGSKETVNVEKTMVTGFNSSVANPNQELTITYEGKTTTYTIKIEKGATPPIPPTPEITPNSWGQRYEYNPFWQIYFGSTEPIAPKQTTKEKTEVVITIGSKIMERAINGVNDKIMMDAAPFIEENRTMLPIRFVAEALGFKVEWVNETKTVVLTNKNNVVRIPVSTNQIIVNGNVYESDVKPVLKDNRTMLPVANIARALGLKDGTDIIWDKTTKKVTIIREQIID